METNNSKLEQNNMNQQNDSQMNLYQNQIQRNMDDNQRAIQEQLMNNQNIQMFPPNQNERQMYPIVPENQNINNPNNIPQNNLNPEMQENPQINSAQINNMPEMSNMNGIDMQMAPHAQQINEQMVYIPGQDTLNHYLNNYCQSQNQPTPEQIHLQQQQMESKENKNIYDYETNKYLYGIAFQNGNCPRLAVSSLEKNLNNKIEILELIDNELKNVYEEKVDYPCTKLLWRPNKNKSSLLAASSDCIQLYEYKEENHSLITKTKLKNLKSKYCGPLTSFDWNSVNDSLLGTASLDTTCTIWDLNKFSIKTQLIAHDKEVFDIQFGNDENTFISGGADGSVRLFDLRSLNHSTIIYETKGSTPINKLALNLQTSNLIAALSLDKNIIYIFDSRANANVSMDELNLHKEPVTGIVWAPDNPSQLCSVSEDCSVIISNVHNEQLAQNTNVSYNAPTPINNVDWCKSFPEWIGITFQKRVQLLRK